MNLDLQSREILDLARHQSRVEWTPERAERVITAVQDRLEHEGAVPRPAAPHLDRRWIIVGALVCALVVAAVVAVATRLRRVEVDALAPDTDTELGARESSLKVESALAQLRAIRAEVDAGRHAEALARLREDSSGVREVFTEEVWILEARALCGNGQREAGRALLADFRARHGELAFQAHARGVCDR